VPSSLEHLDPEALLELADRARESNEQAYCNILKETFGKPVVETRRAYDLLMRLKFKSYITTNFDPLLAIESRKPENKCNGVYTFPALPVDKIHTRAVYYIHGLVEVGVAPKSDQVILGQKGFKCAYNDSGGTLSSFLHQVLIFQPLFFIGCTLREPPLKRIFEICYKVRQQIERERPGQHAPQRYILLPMKFLKTQDNPSGQRNIELEIDESDRFRELDINVVRYNPKDEKHSAIEEILEEWCSLSPIDKRSGFEEGGLTI
jgi:hypothetical protein